MRHLWNEGGGPVYLVEEEQVRDGYNGQHLRGVAYLEPSAFADVPDMARKVLALNAMPEVQDMHVYFIPGKLAGPSDNASTLKLKIDRDKVDYDRLFAAFHKAGLVKRQQWREIFPTPDADGQPGKPVNIIFNSGNGPLQSAEFDTSPDEKMLLHGVLNIRGVSNAGDVRRMTDALNKSAVPHTGLTFESDGVKQGIGRIKFTIKAGSEYNNPDELLQLLSDAHLVEKMSDLRYFRTSAQEKSRQR